MDGTQRAGRRSARQALKDYTVSPRPGDADLYAVFPSSRGLSRKIRAFVDFLVEAFGEGSDNDS